jgi:hypothetical protein
MAESFSYPMGQPSSHNGRDHVLDDTENSPMDLPPTSTSTDSEQSAEMDSKMVSQSLGVERTWKILTRHAVQRRRAQNRASQRAFRERKERHLRNLKITLETLGSKHRHLLESYSHQSETVMQLKGRIAELQTQIAVASLQTERESGALYAPCHAQPFPEFQQFDAFAVKPTSSPAQSAWRHRPPVATGLRRVQPRAPQELPGFEDLLDVPRA